MGHDIGYWRLLAATQAATLLLILGFLAVPRIDIAVAGWFHVAGAGFPAAESGIAVALRDLLRLSFDAICVVVLALLVRAAWQGHRAAVPARLWGFVATVLVVGPGLLANALFKEHWGRARPDAILAFGGDRVFSPPFLITDQCARNCSFVSGEAAAWAAVSIAFGVLLWASMPPARRLWLVVVLAVPALLAGYLRIAMGRHFLSDVVFAWALCALTTLVFYAVFRVGEARAAFTPAAVIADLRSFGREIAGATRSLAARLTA